MSELFEDAVASWCGDIVGHFWLIRNELQKFVEVKFEFFSFNTFDVSEIFWQRVVQPMIKYSHCIFLKGLCWVSVCWILNNALCSMSWVFWFLFCTPLCHQYLAPYVVLSSKYIYNYITFTASLMSVQFEFVQSFPVVLVLYFSDFVCKRSLNSFDSLYVLCFAWIPELAAVLQ